MSGGGTPPLDVLDCHHHVGETGDIPGLPDSADESAEPAARLSIMDRAGVAQAVVIAAHGYDRADGIAANRAQNDAVARFRDACPERFPYAVGVVEPYGERALDELRRCRDELGLRGISFHPRFQGTALDSPWVHTAVARVAELGMVPVLHAINETPDEALWKVAQLGRALPGVPMLVLDAFATFESAKQASFVAELCPDLLFDTSLSHGFDMPALFARRFGARRLLFGTDLYPPPVGRRISHVLDEIREWDLPPDEKAAILAGNCRRLFGR